MTTNEDTAGRLLELLDGPNPAPRISTTPSDGQVGVFDADTGLWVPTTLAGGGGFTAAGEEGDFSAAVSHMYYVDATGGPVNATLPAPTTNGAQVVVKKTDSSVNAVTTLPNGEESIDGASSLVNTTQYQSDTFIADGSNWWLI